MHTKILPKFAKISFMHCTPYPAVTQKSVRFLKNTVFRAGPANSAVLAKHCSGRGQLQGAQCSRQCVRQYCSTGNPDALSSLLDGDYFVVWCFRAMLSRYRKQGNYDGQVQKYEDFAFNALFSCCWKEFPQKKEKSEAAGHGPHHGAEGVHRKNLY